MCYLYLWLSQCEPPENTKTWKRKASRRNLPMLATTTAPQYLKSNPAPKEMKRDVKEIQDHSSMTSYLTNLERKSFLFFLFTFLSFLLSLSICFWWFNQSVAIDDYVLHYSWPSNSSSLHLLLEHVFFSFITLQVSTTEASSFLGLL